MASPSEDHIVNDDESIVGHIWQVNFLVYFSLLVVNCKGYNSLVKQL